MIAVGVEVSAEAVIVEGAEVVDSAEAVDGEVSNSHMGPQTQY